MKKVETVQPIVVVQEILIRWYKDERGSAFARERSQLPRCLRLPDQVPKVDTVYLHQAAQPFFRDGTLHANFSVQEFQSLATDIPQSIRLEKAKAGIVVHLHPRQIGQARKAVELSLGQWLQFKWNERIPYESTWGYEERTLNITLIDRENYDAKLFISSEPDKTFSELVKLY